MSRSQGEHIRCPEGTLINGRFKVVREIGCGNFAKVYKCVDVQHPNATPVAVKILKKEYAADAAFEADILKALAAKDSKGHKVVRMHDTFTWSRCPCFVFALRGASLRSRKMGVARGYVSLDDVRKFSVQMLETLAFLHQDVRMVHTDLKPENILIDDENLNSSTGIGSGWTIADFGSASFFNPAKPDSDLISTRPYRSPEVVLGLPWSTKADIFSMACILFELYYGARLFEVNEDADHLALFEKRIAKIPLAISRSSKHFRRFFDERGALARSNTPGFQRTTCTIGNRHLMEVVTESDFANMLMQMLDVDPARRASAHDMLRHPFITGSRSSQAVSPLRAQMERLSVAPPSSSSAPIDKENAPRQTSKISPPVPSFGAPSAASYAAAELAAGPASSRVPFAAAPISSRVGAYEGLMAPRQSSGSSAAVPMSARDQLAAGKPSVFTPRYAIGGPTSSRW